jgi:CheY-like chemotaxis protein
MAEKILVVDDDPGALTLISFALRREGYQVTTASNGLEALTVASRESFHLAILDIMMPDMDGYEVCRHLRQNPGTAELPIIMLTARSMLPDKISGFRSGTDEYITKPVLPSELMVRVKSLLFRTSLGPGFTGKVRGRMMAFMGTKGGVGTSTLALNCASWMAHQRIFTIYADLSPTAGTISEMVGIAPSYALSVALSRDPNELAPQHLEPCLVEVLDGLRMLPPPSQPRPVPLVAEPLRLRHLSDQLATLAQAVVLDLGGNALSLAPQVLRTMDQIVVVSEATRLGLRLLGESWHRLASLPLEQDRVHLVLINRTHSENAVRAPDAESALGRPALVISAIPDLLDEAEASHTAEVVSRPESPFARQVQELVRILSEKPGAASPEAPRSSP